jgi:glycosyltransferase involved in cell wall biosynthesis
MILIDSIYINNGGGLVLLKYLIQSLRASNLDCFFLIDKRCAKEFKDLPTDKVAFLPSSVYKRHLFYAKNGNKFTKILCFNNIPPTYRTKAEVYTYFHNLTMVESYFNRKPKAKLLANLKLKFINFFSKNTDWYIVQTDYVKDSFLKEIPFAADKIKTIPFFPDIKKYEEQKTPARIATNFIFVSDGNPHKNHALLLKSWALVNQKYPNAKLLLTISNNYTDLLNQIEKCKKSSINVENLGFVNQKSLYNLYLSCQFLIYPSLMESFGLGLIEAAKLGCEIIAADKPYVFAVVNPFAVFNPLDPNDIAEKVLFALDNPTINRTEVKVSDDIQMLINILK